MSFNINFNQPSIKGTQASQDGGAGNLGYMKGRGEKGPRKEDVNSIFDNEQDAFVKEFHDEPPENVIDKIISFFQFIFKKLFG